MHLWVDLCSSGWCDIVQLVSTHTVFAQNNQSGGRLTRWSNHRRRHLEFDHELIASVKQLKIYSRSSSTTDVKESVCCCVPAMPLPLKKDVFT